MFTPKPNAVVVEEHKAFNQSYHQELKECGVQAKPQTRDQEIQCELIGASIIEEIKGP
jgi:hypothetical protein